MAFTQRSQDTRASILAAARHRFAVDGYDRATIRAIAADAGIDPSMVIRYYGSKDGLFAAVIDVDLHLPALSGLPPEHLGEALVRHFLDLWESDGASEALVVLLRSAVTNEAAAERVRTVFADQVATAVGATTGDGARRGALVSSQLLGIALCRYVLRLPPMLDLEHSALVTAVAPTIQRYLTEPLGQPTASPSD